MSNYFVHNLESDKLELHFSKSAYKGLSREQQQQVKSYFLFSRNAEAWVSKAKGNAGGFWSVLKIARELGLEDGGTEGEAISSVEQQERRLERAKARAVVDDPKRYRQALEDRASQNANVRNESIQSRYPSPLLVAGRSGYGANRIRRRNELLDSNLSKYREEMATIDRKVARVNPQHTKQIKDLRYLDNRLKEAQADIRMWQRRATEPGYSAESVQPEIEDAEDLVIYYENLIEELGGITYSKEKLTELGATHVRRRGTWYPIVRLSEKTVTIGRWLGLSDDSTWSTPYVEINGHKTDWSDALIRKPGEKSAPREKSPFKKGDTVLWVTQYGKFFSVETLASIGPKFVRFRINGSLFSVDDIVPRTYKADERLAAYGLAVADYVKENPAKWLDYFQGPKADTYRVDTLANQGPYRYKNDIKGNVRLLNNDLDVMGFAGLEDYYRREILPRAAPINPTPSNQAQAKAKLKLQLLSLEL